MGAEILCPCPLDGKECPNPIRCEIWNYCVLSKIKQEMEQIDHVLTYGE